MARRHSPIKITIPGSTAALAFEMEYVPGSGIAIDIYNGGSNAYSGSGSNALVRMQMKNATDTGNLLLLWNNGQGNALVVYTDKGDAGRAALFLDNSAGSNIVTELINHRGDTDGSNLFYRNLADTATAGPIVKIHNENASDDQYALKVSSKNGINVTDRKLIHLEGNGAGGNVGHINFGDEAYIGVGNSNFYLATAGVTHFANSGWTEQVTIDNETGEIFTKLGIALADGVTAPTAVVGKAYIYVDTADGDLKVRFGDNVTKVIAADT